MYLLQEIFAVMDLYEEMIDWMDLVEQRIRLMYFLHEIFVVMDLLEEMVHSMDLHEQMAKFVFLLQQIFLLMYRVVHKSWRQPDAEDSDISRHSSRKYSDNTLIFFK
jgi:hypothetical protein